MKTDPSSMLHLGSIGSKLILALIIVAQLIFATLSLDSVKAPWVVAPGLVVFVFGALLLARPHPDPFPFTWTVFVVAIGVGTNVLVEWNLPDSGWPGYASWNFGAVTWLLFFLAFRGRIGAAWVGLGLMALVTIVWALSVGRGVLGGVDLVVRHAGTLLMGTLFSVLLTSTSRRITALQDQRVSQAASEASALTELRERESQAAQLNSEARPALERISSGENLDTGERRELELLEASLRDTLRGGTLITARVAEAARAARRRGAEVVLLDDSDGELDPGNTLLVQETVATELAALREGQLTARLLPRDREYAASVVRNSGGQRRRIDLVPTADSARDSG